MCKTPRLSMEAKARPSSHTLKSAVEGLWPLRRARFYSASMTTAETETKGFRHVDSLGQLPAVQRREQLCE
jgi:hypothetical protein